MPSSTKPVFVILPGAAQTSSHYAQLQHFLLSQGYGVLSALLPTVGTSSLVTMQSSSGLVCFFRSIPASAAAKGLGKSDRPADGKATSVMGQIFIAAMLRKGEVGKDLTATFGGTIAASYPCRFLSAVNHRLTAFKSPCPVASWNEQAHKRRRIYIRTFNDQAVPYAVQNKIIGGTEQEWLIGDMKTDHSPQLAASDGLSNVVIELIRRFEVM
ncbi:hypothetical protein G7Y79_00014g036770 [Physcia stellaris]|nr:hypothetical protein G7Y79_00014g036770 [Physcia stellaris]